MNLDDALNDLEGSGTVVLERSGGTAEIDVDQAGPIGARVTRIRVTRDQPWDIAERAATLPQRLRSLPDPIEASEVAPALGGAILRTTREHFDGERYVEVDVRTHSAEVRQIRVREGQRSPDPFSLTREQLGRLLEELEG